MQNKVLAFIIMISFFELKSQNTKTTFGLQYKPIIPAKYFNSSHIQKNSSNYFFNLSPEYSNAFGMILRHKLNKTFSIESGLNYIQRNYALTLDNNIIGIKDITKFGMRSYEIPIQILAYVQISKFWHLNVAFGMSHNVLASNIFSSGENNNAYFQNTERRQGGHEALLANVGIEYRTEEKRHYYIGTSLHRPWKAIGKIYPQYDDNINSFNDDEEFFLEMLGNFITVDFRYFFAE
ncbi:MAG: hypothetical protein VX689_02850 [Bacteroidota bacterium]|nr:hypothetical protein [Bacteroidota bacterium]